MKWTGYTTDKKIRYEAEGSTYKELYFNIQNKDGYDTIIDENAFELKLLEKNGIYRNELDIDEFDELSEVFTTLSLNDYDYRDMILESTNQAYYHYIEE